MHETRRDLWTVFRPLTLVAHMKLKTRMGSNMLARQLFGMLNFAKTINCLSYSRGRRKKMNKIEIFKFGFFKLVKG